MRRRIIRRALAKRSLPPMDRPRRTMGGGNTCGHGRHSEQPNSHASSTHEPHEQFTRRDSTTDSEVGQSTAERASKVC